MHLRELRIENLRILANVDLALSPGWNVFVGANGAGKTSVLEAVFQLSHGRSFRSATRDALTRLGTAGHATFGRLVLGNGQERRVGLARVGGRLEARVDGESVGIGTLVQTCAVVCFEPGSHELIHGAAEERRRYLDWGVFHVEHVFLREWRRYQRALKQRNVLVREGAADTAFEPWEIEMAAAGEALTASRRRYLDALAEVIHPLLANLLGELGSPTLGFSAGWTSELTLAEALREGRARDRERGHTMRGPHRADWTIGFEKAPRREHLSRGQEKLCALAFMLAQARLHAAATGDWPVLCFDDIASELDREHLRIVLHAARQSGAQVLVSSTEVPDEVARMDPPPRVFHVEQGVVNP